jgi:uncharacterized protein (TIGR02266 family)
MEQSEMSSKDHSDKSNDSTQDGAERRQWQRVLVDLQVDYGEQDNYLFAYIKDISATGIFIKTQKPEEPGTQLNLRFTPSDGGQELQLEGEVIWVNRFRPGNPESLNPGMGVRFVGLDAEQRDRLDQFVKTFAYL